MNEALFSTTSSKRWRTTFSLTPVFSPAPTFAKGMRPSQWQQKQLPAPLFNLDRNARTFRSSMGIRDSAYYLSSGKQIRLRNDSHDLVFRISLLHGLTKLEDDQAVRTLARDPRGVWQGRRRKRSVPVGASSCPASTPLRRDLDAWQLPNLARKTKTVLRPRRLLAVVAIYNAAARGACQVTGVDFKGLNSQSTFPKRVVPGRR